jgi:hypothetical protein
MILLRHHRTRLAFCIGIDTVGFMSNVTELKTRTEPISRRAQILDNMMTEERWSTRRAAAALNLTHTYVGARRTGKVEMSFPDIELFASLFKMKPVELFVILSDEPVIEPEPTVTRPKRFSPATTGNLTNLAAARELKTAN